MTETEIIIECAKLDGFEDILGSLTAYIAGGDATFLRLSNLGCEPIWSEEREGLICCSVPNYTTSRDAIVPVIEKQFVDYLSRNKFILKLNDVVTEDLDCNNLTIADIQFLNQVATPLQLCEALLRATGKWKD